MNRPNKRYHENTPEHSSSDDDNGSVTPKKKLTYEHKFQLKWLKDSRFADWIVQSKKCSNKAYCTACDCEISGSVSLLERHGNTDKHKKNILSKNQPKK